MFGKAVSASKGYGLVPALTRALQNGLGTSKAHLWLPMSRLLESQFKFDLKLTRTLTLSVTYWSLLMLE
jgi:hypothetical protein